MPAVVDNSGSIILSVLVSVGLIFLGAMLAAIWTYFCPRRNRQIGLAIALQEKAKNRVKQARDCFWTQKNGEENEVDTWVDEIKMFIQDKKIPLFTSDQMVFLLESTHSEIFVLQNESLLKLLYDFDELDRYMNISLDKFGSEEFTQISTDRQLKFIDHFSEVVEKYIGTGEKLVKELSRYIEARKKRISFCGKW